MNPPSWARASYWIHQPPIAFHSLNGHRVALMQNTDDFLARTWGEANIGYRSLHYRGLRNSRLGYTKLIVVPCAITESTPAHKHCHPEREHYHKRRIPR